MKNTKRPQCSKCKSTNLGYYEKREHNFDVLEDFSLDYVSDYACDNGNFYQTHQVECRDCGASSDDDKGLQKIVDKIHKLNDR